jgi:hypothetical protein
MAGDSSTQRCCPPVSFEPQTPAKLIRGFAVADRKQEFLAELKAEQNKPAPRTVGHVMDLGAFTRGTLEFLKKVAREQVDTEEERDAIVKIVMDAADQFVAPTFDWGWRLVRKNFEAFLDAQIDSLPELLAESGPV